MRTIAFIAAGGAFGSVLRYLISGWVQRFSGVLFPFGTLMVNAAGCLCMGVCAAAFFGSYLIRDEYRMGIMVGILGGFTTFSSYSWETLALINDGDAAKAVLNIVASNALGLLAVWAGYRLGHVVLGV